MEMTKWTAFRGAGRVAAPVADGSRLCRRSTAAHHPAQRPPPGRPHLALADLDAGGRDRGGGAGHGGVLESAKAGGNSGRDGGRGAGSANVEPQRRPDRKPRLPAATGRPSQRGGTELSAAASFSLCF